MQYRTIFVITTLVFFITSCLDFDDDPYDNSDDIAFLEEYAEREDVETTESGLLYRVIEEGDGDRPESQSDEVRIHYEGTLIDGEVFDSSYERDEPAEYQINGFIAGFAEGLMLMSEGSEYELVIPAELGYGDFPPSGIPPGATLIFQVELLNIL